MTDCSHLQQVQQQVVVVPTPSPLFTGHSMQSGVAFACISVYRCVTEVMSARDLRSSSAVRVLQLATASPPTCHNVCNTTPNLVSFGCVLLQQCLLRSDLDFNSSRQTTCRFVDRGLVQGNAKNRRQDVAATVRPATGENLAPGAEPTQLQNTTHTIAQAPGPHL
jgi:hypothetical protein